jgi:hypothetical protein
LQTGHQSAYEKSCFSVCAFPLREMNHGRSALALSVPICSSCQEIRNDIGYWDRIETDIQDHSEATFSHRLCPDCAP